MFYIYIIHSSKLQRYYVGSTQNVENRLQQHNSGKSSSTLAGVPWQLVHTESFATRSEAILREARIKSRGIGRYLDDIKRLSSS